MDYKIACIIVTYNRKELLKKCLNAVICQTFKPHTVYIIDNASSDGTMDAIKEWGFYDCKKNGIQIKYKRILKNKGSANGFYYGIKYAYEDYSYDGFWVMDDDGEPTDYLKELVPYLKERDYIAPLVLSVEDRKSMSFTIAHESVDQFLLKSKVENGCIENYDCPFNGILYSSKLIQTIGYPKKEMYHWGVEINYRLRAQYCGFNPVTIISAIHYHPICRSSYTFYKGLLIGEINTDWKLYCSFRNNMYNHFYVGGVHLGNIVRNIKYIYVYTQYYKNKYGKGKYKLFLDAYFSALTCNFKRLSKYFDE